MLFADAEKSKDEDKHKNIIDAEAPLHEVGADILDGGVVTILVSHEHPKGKGQQYPEYGLPKGFFDGKKVTILDAQESYRLSSFAKANCLVVLKEDRVIYEEEEIVDIHLLP